MPKLSNFNGIVSTFTYKSLFWMVLAYEGLPLLLCYENQVPTSLSYTSLSQAPVAGNTTYYVFK